MHARARIELNGGADRGLSAPMPSPCKSLILWVENDAGAEDEMIGLACQGCSQSKHKCRHESIMDGVAP
jgi:flavoprotein